jgi:hypothetical protein
VPQAGTAETLDTLSDRPMYRLAYRVYSDHASMVVNHSVTAGSAVGVRWYELRSPLSPSPSFSVYQQGTFAPDSTYRWMGSAAMDISGNLAIGYSASSSSINPALRYTGRNAGDPLNTLQAESSILIGTGSQTTGLSRWGDYAALRIDPTDDCTFWFSTEYEKTNGTFNWSTRIGSFKFTNCLATTVPDFSISASPSTLSLAKGATGSSTISVTALNGYSNTVNMTVSGCPLPATCTATLTPTTLTPTASSTLSVTTGTAAAGSYTLTVQGTDGNLTHNTTVSLTIQNPSDFSLAVSPTSLAIRKGNSGSATVTVSPMTGPFSVALSVNGLPSGATATFNPSTVSGSSAATSTLTVNTKGNTQRGTYTLTIQGIGSGVTHTVSLGLTIQ